MKPEIGVFGFVDGRGREVGCESLEELGERIAKAKGGVDLAWSPANERLVAPEELVGLRKILRKRRRDWAADDISDGKRMTVIAGVVVLWAAYAAFSKTGRLAGVWDSPTVGIGAILLLIFGLVPWYEGWKVLRKRGDMGEGFWESEIREGRFDSWLDRQSVRGTSVLLGLMVFVGAVQFFVEGKLDWTGKSLAAGALLKGDDAEWWRYFTAPFLHGHVVHWVMNFAGLKYLARRVEVLARWPQLVLVFLITALVGGWATMAFLPGSPSVGASGGILGLLGFLLVFETFHSPLVPKSARRRLLAGVVMVGLMGVLGFRFIDNAAHVGGLLAGMAYAGIVFPPSKSPDRPEVLPKDKVAGWVAAGVIFVSVVGVVVRLLG